MTHYGCSLALVSKNKNTTEKYNNTRERVKIVILNYFRRLSFGPPPDACSATRDSLMTILFFEEEEDK